MHTSDVFAPINTHSNAWLLMRERILHQRIPHALLFTGPGHANIPIFVTRLLGTLLCTQEDKPCGRCQACRWVRHRTHPDIHYLAQEAAAKSLKIDQIRRLQNDIYQTPQCATHRYIVLENSEQLNEAATHALLKILEEPPAHVRFILVSNAPQKLPATIKSRCQIVAFPDPAGGADYLSLGQFYEPTSSRAQITQQQDTIIDALYDLMRHKITVCQLAKTWSTFDSDDLWWFLYLLLAQLIHDQYTHQSPPPRSPAYQELARRQTPYALFLALSALEHRIELSQQGISLNQTLALETWLQQFCLPIRLRHPTTSMM